MSNETIVVHVLDGLNLGGIDNLACSLIREFNRRHHVRSFLLSLSSTQESALNTFLSDSTLCLNSALIPGKTWKGLNRCLKTYQAAKKHHFTTAIIYPFNASLLPALIGLKLAGVRRILVHLGNPVATTSPAKQKTHLLCALFSALGVTFVPCSQYVKSSLNRNCLLRRQAPIIPNGCDTRAILSRALKARKQDWTAGPTERDGARRHVVMVARLDHIKDHNTLLKAFAIARRQRTEAWGLWLVGDGDNDASLRKLSAELGMNPQDIFLGRRHDIPEILGAADLFAFSTTVAEGFGIALVEAMAAGLPILASDVPACREVLDQGASGRLVPAGDVQAWVSHLEALMEDAQLRIALAKRSSAAASQFDLSTTAQHWLRLVEA